ncbi:MAG: class I SAM-dependent methyltransferase [Solirubrobacteraceae bacterium]
MTASSDEWGRRPRDWAELAEPSNEPLFAEVLRELNIGAGRALLDIGCGSGYAARMAAALGATVTGIDITPDLIEIARERVPIADFRIAGMDTLPFEDNTFDAAVGFNSFQFADDPARAVQEAARVVKHGGLVAATTFAEPERNASTALHLALEPLRHGAPAATTPKHLPYELSTPGGLEALLTKASLAPVTSGEVPLNWAHRNAAEAVRAILASAGGAMAIEAAGEDAARTTLENALTPFTRPDGTVSMSNVFRYAIGRRV